MSNLSRRKLITTGLAATASVSGLAVAARFAERYGLLPPDHGGLYGAGHALTYASQRLLTRQSGLARSRRCLLCADRARSSQPTLDLQVPCEVFAQGCDGWIVVNQRDVDFTTQPVTEISGHRDRRGRIKPEARERLLVTDLIRMQLEQRGEILPQPLRYIVGISIG